MEPAQVTKPAARKRPSRAAGATTIEAAPLVIGKIQTAPASNAVSSAQPSTAAFSPAGEALHAETVAKPRSRPSRRAATAPKMSPAVEAQAAAPASSPISEAPLGARQDLAAERQDPAVGPLATPPHDRPKRSHHAAPKAAAHVAAPVVESAPLAQAGRTVESAPAVPESGSAGTPSANGVAASTGSGQAAETKFPDRPQTQNEARATDAPAAATLDATAPAAQAAPATPQQLNGQPSPATFRPQQSGQARQQGQFRQPHQQRPPQGQRPQPVAPRNQPVQPPQSQLNDFNGNQNGDARNRRRRRRRGRGPTPIVGQNGGNSTSTPIVANPPPQQSYAPQPQQGYAPQPQQGYAFEERQPAPEFVQQQRMPVFEVHGMLDFVPNGEAFLREEDLRMRSDDPLVSVRDVRRFDLRNGDIVRLEVRPGRGRGPVTVERVLTINDVPFEQMRTRKRFEDLTPIYPDRMMHLETGQTPYTTRMIDMIAPVGFGQRALIVSPPKAGKTTVLKHIGHGVVSNYPDASLILCLVGERPEEVTDLRISLPQAILFASSFDEETERHGHLAEMALERARRLAEMGKDVVVLWDSITRLARAYNLGGGGGGRTLSGGMDASALTTARRIFGAARAIEQGGSLTIIATCLVDTGSRLDDVVYEEFKGTGNMELHLDRGLAERRIFPAIDISKSSTRKEELLLDPATLRWVVLLRRRMAGIQSIPATEQFIDRLSKTPSNKVFLELLSRTQS